MIQMVLDGIEAFTKQASVSSNGDSPILSDRNLDMISMKGEKEIDISW